MVILSVLYMILAHHFGLALRGILLPLSQINLGPVFLLILDTHVQEVDLFQQLLLVILELPHGCFLRAKAAAERGESRFLEQMGRNPEPDCSG